jgi:hypothetical protein
MFSALIGNVFTLKHTCLNAAGAPVDATTVTFTVKPPIGIETTGSYTRHTGTGLYEYDFSPAVMGPHTGDVATTGPKSEASTEFYVLPSPV